MLNSRGRLDSRNSILFSYCPIIWGLQAVEVFFDCLLLCSLVMTHYSQSTAAYAPVVDLEFDDEKADESPRSLVTNAHGPRAFRLPLALCIGILCMILGLGAVVLFQHKGDSRAPASTACTNPTIRREWRDLSDTEKGDYIQAVQCLRSSPSRLGLNQTLYDDFPYVHSRNGEACE